MKNPSEIRVAFINTHPIQYFAPLYVSLNGNDDVSITAIYVSDYSIRGAADHGFGRTVKWDIDLLSGYQARFIRGAERRDEAVGSFSMIAPAVWHEVHTGGFDALVVHGHSPAPMLLATVAAKVARIPIFMHCETHLGLHRSALKSVLRRPLLGAYYQWFDGVLAIGTANRQFFRAMGVPEGRIFSMPYAVDNRRFMSGSRLTDIERRDLRAGFGVDDDSPIVLYAAKFQRRKRPADLLRAAANLVRNCVQFHLVMVGSGEMEGELRTLSRQLELPNAHFAGFVNQAALPRVYAACDVFVLPSENEPWGLAVNEAMCAGLPIVASAETGCVPDLVHDGRNGHTFPAGNVTGLAEAMRPLLEDPGLRRRMGEASRDIISGWSYAECRAGLLAALASVGLRPATAESAVRWHRK